MGGAVGAGFAWQAKDAFAGCKPQRVHCTWLSERDKQSARSAEIIRLVVDEERGDCGPWVNADYQESFLKNVQEFIGPTSAVLATYAGTITAPIDPPDPTLDSLRSGLGALQAALRRVHVGRGEMLLGMDGCVPGETTRLQTVVHLRGQSTGVTTLTTARQRLPQYWFDSRRRYFLKNHGWLYTSAVDSAWFVAHLLWEARRFLQGKREVDPPQMLGDYARNSVFVRGFRL